MDSKSWVSCLEVLDAMDSMSPCVQIRTRNRSLGTADCTNLEHEKVARLDKNAERLKLLVVSLPSNNLKRDAHQKKKHRPSVVRFRTLSSMRYSLTPLGRILKVGNDEKNE